MRTAHRINIVLLHQHDILEHRRAAQHAPGGVVEFVPIHAVYTHGAIIDQELALGNLDIAESRPDRIVFVTGLCMEGHQHRVQIGIFVGPQIDPLEEMRKR